MKLITFVIIAIGSCFAFIYNKYTHLNKEKTTEQENITLLLRERVQIILDLVIASKNSVSHGYGNTESLARIGEDLLIAESLSDILAIDRNFIFTANQLFSKLEDPSALENNQDFLKQLDLLQLKQKEIETTKNYHNACVNQINNFIQSVPINIIAKLFGFRFSSIIEIDYFA